MKDLGKRILVSLIGVGMLFFLIVGARLPYLSFVVSIVVALLGAVAIGELWYLAKKKFFTMPCFIVVLGAFLEILAFYFASQSRYMLLLPLWVFFGFFFFFFLFHLASVENAITDIAVSTFSMIYVAVPLGLLLVILLAPAFDGRWWLFFLIATVKMNDIGGYFIGKLLGKTKLASTVSPHKTIAGSLGGIFFALLTSFLFFLLSRYVTQFSITLSHAMILGFIFAIGAQVGDLAESLLKRDANVKDSNKIPGMGGILDMFDSLLFNIPILFFYFCYALR